MTKRFTNTDNGFIVDYKSKQKVLNLYDVVDVLNELATKCSQLEKENEQLKSALKELKEIGDYQYNRMNELSEENEQLKNFIRKEFPKSYKHILEGFE